MTRQERENNLRIGDDVEFKTNSGLLERVVIDIGQRKLQANTLGVYYGLPKEK